VRETVFVIGFNLAVACAFGRAGGVLVFATRSLAMRKRFEAVRFGATEAFVLPEPVLLAGAAYLLLVNRESSSAVSAPEATAALAGGLVALAGLALVLWTLISWRKLFVGHAVLGDQELVTSGAFGLVRHPVYLGAIVIWSGLSLCFLSAAAAAVTALYVLPAYVLYARSEERMMLDSFGERYSLYRREVPMLLPRLPRQRA
jgi:protein-S-isoprenylcysteine O-methyltransferase Ste14